MPNKAAAKVSGTKIFCNPLWRRRKTDFFYENADLAACAATYAFHLSKAHAFVDGNKRVAAVAAEVFLLINRAILNAGDDALEKLYLNIADGTLTRDEVEEFFRAHLYIL